jgi:hypothetical protein
MAAAVAAPLLDEDDWVFPHSLVYKGNLLNFMSFMHNRLDNIYPKDHVFTKEELLAPSYQEVDELESRWCDKP